MKTFKKFIEENSLLNRRTLSPKELAKKHKEPLSKVLAAIKQGSRIEREHTKNDKVAKEIAQDHIGEFPNYYSALKKMETKLKEKIQETSSEFRQKYRKKAEASIMANDFDIPYAQVNSFGNKDWPRTPEAKAQHRRIVDKRLAGIARSERLDNPDRNSVYKGMHKRQIERKK